MLSLASSPRAMVLQNSVISDVSTRTGARAPGINSKPRTRQGFSEPWDVWRSVALPGRYGLKETLQAFGINHAISHVVGRVAAAQAMRSLDTGESIPNELFLYNREDVTSLHLLVRAVEGLCGSAARKPQRLRIVDSASQTATATPRDS